MYKEKSPVCSEERVDSFCKSIESQFYARTVVEGGKRGVDLGVKLKTEKRAREIRMTFIKGDEAHSITIPIPYMKSGVALITQNEVTRALCNFLIEIDQLELDFINVMYYIMLEDSTGIIPSFLVKKIPFLQQIVYSFESGSTPAVIHNLQRAINEIISRMPLHETDMNSWVMNRRLIIIDPMFDDIQDPRVKLDYHIAKSKRYFPRGWTSIGLSDGSLANRNYILKTDIRKLTPFGMRYHNPQRNLYSTLGMKGDELPLIRSASMQRLMDQGITRKGWNWFTLFVDIPDVFEDQIMVDESHKDKYIEHIRRIQCFGKMLVKQGDVLRYKQVISEAPDGEKKLFDTVADRAVVEEINEAEAIIGGTPINVFNVMVSCKRHLKDGVKVTNTHGNKGVIRLTKLGYAIDPRTGEERKIDVIVSAKSIKKRKNFGQLLEALSNNVNKGIVQVVDDKAEIPLEKIEDRLEQEGFPRDGVWKCKTYVGELEGVCGTVFWGATKGVEDQLWDVGDTIRRNGRELRVAGLKFSTVEFRALITRFGKDNAVLDEIMSYAQGTEDLHEELNVLKSKRGELPEGKPVINVKNIKPLDQSSGTIVPKDTIEGTVVDEFFCPHGFILQLPVTYQIALNKLNRIITEGIPQPLGPDVAAAAAYDKIYVPSSNLRKCWRHETGRYGLSEIGALINNLVIISHRYLENPENGIHFNMLHKAVFLYFKRVADMMGTKKGEISTYGMAVRYPFSAKAVATLSNSLPKNTVEIHRSMAKVLKVRNGDVVLVERFPCLGFMSVRPQKVRITSDRMCKYTIRASGNCLGSLSLDFDGDVLFIASFHSPEAKETLAREWKNPNKSCYDVIKELNKKAGVPHTKCMSLQEYEIGAFEDLTGDTHAVLVKRATGVKSHTGPVIALAYNLMRVLENSDIKENQKTNVAIEVFLDKVGNSVFKQKHGVKSLHDIVIDAICMCDVNTLVEHGFNRGTSTIICEKIRQKARELGINDVAGYHKFIKQRSGSTLINRIVREQNKIYFASRARLEGCSLLTYLDQPVVDWPSKMLKWVLSGKAYKTRNALDIHMEERIGVDKIKDEALKDSCQSMCALIDGMMNVRKTGSPSPDTLKQVKASYKKNMKSRRGQKCLTLHQGL